MSIGKHTHQLMRVIGLGAVVGLVALTFFLLDTVFAFLQSNGRILAVGLTASGYDLYIYEWGDFQRTTFLGFDVLIPAVAPDGETIAAVYRESSGEGQYCLGLLRRSYSAPECLMSGGPDGYPPPVQLVVAGLVD